MRLTQKLALSMLLLLSAALSLGGAWTIHQNFVHALRAAEQQSLGLHARECYQLESAFDESCPGSSPELQQTAELFSLRQKSLLGEGATRFSLLDPQGSPLYNSLPRGIPHELQRRTAAEGQSSLRFCRAGDEVYLLTASALRSRELHLVCAYPITQVFEERDRQLRQYAALELAVLAVAGLLALVISALLTRPLHRLEAAARDIAAGAYSSRVGLSGQDEVARLGRSFDAMARAVEAHTAALEAETEKQKRFVADFSHELKTPMTSILGYADLLRSGEQPADRRQKAANYIYREAGRLERLGRSLLSLLELEKEPLLPEAVPVELLFADVLRSLDEAFLPVEVRCPAGACILAERELLADLLRNLLLNASHAHPRDGRLHLFCEAAPNGWRLAVQDRGDGIPAEELTKITEPFYRADKSRSRESGGNGLGLSLCEQIARLHGSHLEFDSTEGVGTCVSLIIKEARP